MTGGAINLRALTRNWLDSAGEEDATLVNELLGRLSLSISKIDIDGTITFTQTPIFGEPPPYENLTVVGDLTVGDAITCATLTASSFITVNGIQNNAGLNVVGPAVFAGSLQALNFISTGGMLCQGGLDVSGATTLQSSLDVTGGVLCHSTLQVTETATFDGSVTATAGIACGGGLSVGGITVLDSTLNVTGATTLAGGIAGALAVTGLSSLSGGVTTTTLTASGAVACQTTLNVTGDASVGSLTTNSLHAASAPFTVSCDGHFSVAGTATLSGSVNVASLVFIGAPASNAKMTSGLTMRQGAADDEILAFKSSDVAHGITNETETDTYTSFNKIIAGGGLTIRTAVIGEEALRLQPMASVAQTGKSAFVYGALHLYCGYKSGADITSFPANANLVCISNRGTNRMIFDGDGDAHLDVGTTWTNFDDADDVAVLQSAAIALARDGDPLKDAFVADLVRHRAAIEALPGKALVTFNDDGHHFVNMSRLTMLLVGAIRQLSARIETLETTLLEA